MPKMPRMPKMPTLSSRRPERRPASRLRGFGCCGKKAIDKTKEGDELLASPVPGDSRSSSVPSSPVRSPSTIDRLRASVMGDGQGTGPEETEWKLGGRYKVLRSAPTYVDPNCGGIRSGELRVKDLVLLLETRNYGTVESGLVLPSPPDEPGWIILEEESGLSPLERRRQLEGSWDMGARYMVKSPATIREQADMDSAEVGEVRPPEEVLVLELGVGKNADHMTRNVRLRMLIRTESEVIGWISPETSTGERLLYPVNLLGPQVVELHRRTMVPGSTIAPRCSMRAVQDGDADHLPWKAGAKYRVLEKVVLRRHEDLSSAEIGKITAGCIVAVLEVSTSPCPDLGMCPSARVRVDSGPEEGSEGWVRCSHKDGHDVIDTRDQLEASKVVRQLRLSQGLVPPDEIGEQAQAREGGSDSTSGTRDGDEDDDKGDADGQMRFPEAPGAARGQSRDSDADAPGFVPPDKASRMFEEANEDRPIGEPTVVEDRSYHCCTCGVKRG